MTTTVDTPDTDTTDVTPGRGTVKPAQLVAALTAVLPHACDDKQLPLLATVKFEAADGELVLIATDRYTLATYTIEWEGGPVNALLPLAEARDLLRFAKTVKRPLDTLQSLDLHFEESPPDAGHLTAVSYDRRTVLPLGDYLGGYIKWRPVMPSYDTQTAERSAGVGEILFNPNHLAKFAKAGDKHDAAKLIFGASPVKPVLVLVGDRFRGVIMPHRPPGGA